MCPRKSGVQVTSEKAKDWLERNERGESPPAIAEADTYDPRTVRKYLDIARQEKETKEARSSYLHSALERHYDDLCRYAEKLGERYSGRVNEFGMRMSSETPYQQQLEIALRKHIPRSPIWSLLSKQERLYTSRAELIPILRRKIEAGITSDQRLLANLTDEENGVVPGLLDALRGQVEPWAQGEPGLNVKDNLISKPLDNSYVDLNYGVYFMGKVRKGHVKLVGDAILDWTTRIKEWEEYRDLEKNFSDLPRVEQKLQEEIAVIVLRRVVPGRCRYCPL